MALLRLASLVAATALAGTCSLPARAGVRTCPAAGYSYAGVQTLHAEAGIAATITPLRGWHVTSGHVAAWVGVGGAGMGAQGADEWLQIGVAGLPDGTSEVYYEVTLPGSRPQYAPVEPAAAAAPHRVAVVERAPNVWQATLDGRPVSPQFTLPGSHDAWAPVATGESYDGGAAACNAYSARLSSIAYPAKSGWAPVGDVRRFVDGGHTLGTLGADSIVVTRS